MANWNGLRLTGKGELLQAKVEAGEILKFTTLKLGDGVYTPDIDMETLEDLISPKQNLGIASKEADGKYCRISTTISNASLNTGYYVRELGVFAEDPDDGEILYMYATDNTPDFLPPGGGSIATSQEFSVNIAISNAKNVQIVVNPKALATMGYVGASIKEHDDLDDAHAPAFAAHNVDTHAHPNRLRPDLRRSTSYAVGDIAFHDGLPSWAYLECVQAGTTSDTEPIFGGVIPKQVIDDGTVMWKIQSIKNSSDMTGCIKMFAGNAIPDGYLLCDGSAINRADYEDLFAVIGGTYGAGDGIHTFNLPNLIGRFIEGAATSGVYINAGLPNITGNFDFTPTSQYDVYHAGGAFYGISYNPGNGATGFALGPLWKDTSFGTTVIGFSASRLSGIYGASGTVQPNALTMLPIIKY